MWGNAKEIVGRAYAKIFFHNAIPAHAANSPYLQHFVDVAGQYGIGVKAPTSYEIMNKYLPMGVKELKEYINGLKNQWPEYVVTIMSNGWTGPTRQSFTNFMVYCDSKTVFLKSIEASDVVKDYKFIYKHMIDVIKVVEKENVVQIVTDNGSNYKKAGQKIMSKYNIFWTPCAAHCIDLMMKDIGKKKAVRKVVDEARSVTKFLYNHGHILSIMRNMCGGDLVRPGLTRFATNYIALQSMLDKKVLRMVDGDKKPTMGSLYYTIRLMKEEIKAVGPRSYQGYHTIIDNRWTNKLLHPLHSAAYYLNPNYQYTQQLGTRADLIEDLEIVVAKLEPDATVHATALAEIKRFRDALGSIGRPAAIAGRHKTLPGCERNFSTFNLIHSKRRNMLGHENLHKLLYVHYNTGLMMKHTSIEQDRVNYTDPIDLIDIFYENDEDDPLYEWVKEIGEPVMDAAGGRPNPIIVEQMQVNDDTLPPDTEGLTQPIAVPIQGSDNDLSIDSPSDDDTCGIACGAGAVWEVLELLVVGVVWEVLELLLVEAVVLESGWGSTASYGYGYGYEYGYGYPYGTDTQTQSQSGSYGYEMSYDYIHMHMARHNLRSELHR
ncbi:uncharacterized protein LOC143850392 [Tasmannia lanceolata]|uniref:uncharacterized protein LOC143850392 n=1 Tax=Tasmannia lanceolata TaxID=3420 RepID=UPI00406395DE